MSPRIPFPALLSALLLCPPLFAADDPLAAVEKVAKADKIKVVTADPEFPVKTAHGKIDGKAAGEKALAKYAPIFAFEFALYPPELIAASKLERVVLCADLSFAGQKRAAIPDYEHDTLYLDVARGMPNLVYVRKVLHHEFFHVVDWKDDGSVYKDEGWAAENPKGFKYGTGGAAAQKNANTAALTTEYPGFLNHYSTTGVEEDKAEVFAHLMADPIYMTERAKDDAVLAAKVARMKCLLAKFCPQVDDQFWNKVSETKRPKEKLTETPPGR